MQLQTGLCVLPSEYCGTICSPSCAYQLYLTVLGLYLFCDDHRQTTIFVSSPRLFNFPDFSLTNLKFPDFSWFTWWVTTLSEFILARVVT